MVTEKSIPSIGLLLQNPIIKSKSSFKGTAKPALQNIDLNSISIQQMQLKSYLCIWQRRS